MGQLSDVVSMAVSARRQAVRKSQIADQCCCPGVHSISFNHALIASLVNATVCSHHPGNAGEDSQPATIRSLLKE